MCSMLSHFVAYFSKKLGLLHKIKLSLGLVLKREHERNEYFSQLKVVFGLDAVHYVLNDYRYPEWVESAYYERTITDIDELDYDFLIRSTETTKKRKKKSYPIETFYSENESLNGLSLVWTQDHSISLKIGELVALSQNS